jgi:CRP/FNR family cyclic AMP-dependent transcriptional regulator
MLRGAGATQDITGRLEHPLWRRAGELCAMTWINVLGYAASASVLATFCMSTMVPLRVIALASNVLFIAFGALAHIYPVLVLHIILLPVNITRLIQILRLIQGVKAAQVNDLSVESLLPFMSHRFVKAGEVLMSKGDKADRMYYLVDGKLEIRELGKTLERGAVLGEIGIFARDQRRTATVVCVSDCELYEMSESKAKQLYFQDRSFGLAVLQLIIARLMENMKLLQPAPVPNDNRQGGVAASA